MRKNAIGRFIFMQLFLLELLTEKSYVTYDKILQALFWMISQWRQVVSKPPIPRVFVVDLLIDFSVEIGFLRPNEARGICVWL